MPTSTQQDVKYASEDGGGKGINGVPLQLLISSLQRGSFRFLPHLPATSVLPPAGRLSSLQPPLMALFLSSSPAITPCCHLQELDP